MCVCVCVCVCVSFHEDILYANLRLGDVDSKSYTRSQMIGLIVRFFFFKLFFYGKVLLRLGQFYIHIVTTFSWFCCSSV